MKTATAALLFAVLFFMLEIAILGTFPLQNAPELPPPPEPPPSPTQDAGWWNLWGWLNAGDQIKYFFQVIVYALSYLGVFFAKIGYFLSIHPSITFVNTLMLIIFVYGLVKIVLFGG